MATREQVIKLMSDYIKETSKNVLVNGGKSNCVVPIQHLNWRSGFSRGKWVCSEIAFNGNKYKFTDKEISNREFCRMVEQALSMSKVSGKVFSDESYGGDYQFERLEIYAKPCNEFNSLNKLLVKLGAKPLDLLSVFYVRICGKRSSWGDSGSYNYLAYDSKTCSSIIDYIKKNKIRGGKIAFKVEGYMSHGDDTDYRIAMYQESEWYGCRGNYLALSLLNSKLEVKKNKEFYWRR